MIFSVSVLSSVRSKVFHLSFCVSVSRNFYGVFYRDFIAICTQEKNRLAPLANASLAISEMLARANLLADSHLPRVLTNVSRRER